MSISSTLLQEKTAIKLLAKLHSHMIEILKRLKNMAA